MTDWRQIGDIDPIATERRTTAGRPRTTGIGGINESTPWGKSRAKNPAAIREQDRLRRAVSYERDREWFARVKSTIGCQRCRETHAGSLDFHHIDPKQKTMTVSLGSGSRSKLIPEMMKCNVLCATCHRKQHNGDAIHIDPIREIPA